MKRKAFIVVGLAYNKEQSLKMEKLASVYQTFLSSNMGGAWESNEIHIVKEPTISDLEQVVNEEKPDYAIMVLIGHGAKQDDRQLFHLNKDTIIQAGQVPLDVPRQLIIVESCRGVKENIEFTSIKDRIPTFKKGGILRIPIGRKEARQRFDKELVKTEKGTSICFACSKDESAIDFCFSNKLLLNANQWHERVTSKATLSISEIMQLTITEVNYLIKSNYNEEQRPELIGKGDFPFVVSKF